MVQVMAAPYTKVKAIPHAHYITLIVFSVIVPHLPYVKKGFFEKIGIITVIQTQGVGKTCLSGWQCDIGCKMTFLTEDGFSKNDRGNSCCSKLVED